MAARAAIEFDTPVPSPDEESTFHAEDVEDAEVEYNSFHSFFFRSNLIRLRLFPRDEMVNSATAFNPTIRLPFVCGYGFPDAIAKQHIVTAVRLRAFIGQLDHKCLTRTTFASCRARTQRIRWDQKFHDTLLALFECRICPNRRARHESSRD